MKKFFLILFVASFAATFSSCQKHDEILLMDNNSSAETRFDPIYIGGNWQDNLINNDTTMVFGPQLANPYNVDVMRQALATIREQDPDFFFPTINTSHYYVRFRPESYDEMYDLFARDTSIIYFDFPLDREVVSGNSYHDPAIVDTLPTYQYASIRKTKWNNLINGFDIEYEILDELFIPDDAGITIIGYTPRPGVGDITPINPGDSTIWGHPIFPGSVADPNSSGTSVSWNAVNELEDMAYQITGNSDEETDANGTIASPASTTAETMSSSNNGRWTPSGRITVYDDIAGIQIPLVGAKVVVNRCGKVVSGTTDSDGYYTCSGSFKNKAKYKIKWESNRWDIRNGLTGQAYYNGPKKQGEWNLSITNNKYNKQLGYATIHRALHRLFYDNIGGLDRLQRNRKLKVAYFNDENNPSIGGVYGKSTFPSDGISVPNIKIYGAVVINNELEMVTTQQMFFTVCHEVGHWMHYKKNKDKFNDSTLELKESWTRLVEYVVGKIEYESLGLWKGEGCLNQTETVINENGDSEVLMIPQEHYNFQVRNNISVYCPIFVDLVDNYNQKRYHELTGNYATNINDDISLPVSFVAPYIYSSLTVQEVGQKILAHINVTGDAVDLLLLFENYGYNITEN